MLVPFEDEETTGTQNAETFCEALGQGVFPISSECAILCLLKTCWLLFRVLSPPTQVWRVEYHHTECVVGEIHACKIPYDIRLDGECSAIAQSCFLTAYVLKQNAGVVLVEIKHLATTASIEDWLICFHVSFALGGPSTVRFCILPTPLRVPDRIIYEPSGGTLSFRLQSPRKLGQRYHVHD